MRHPDDGDRESVVISSIRTEKTDQILCVVVQEVLTRSVLVFRSDVGIVAPHVDIGVYTGLLESLG